VPARGLGDHQLGADAVGGGHQQGIRVARGLGVEQPAEAAELGRRAGPPGRRRQRLDGLDEGVAGVDVDPGLLVSGGAVFWPFSGNSFLLGRAMVSCLIRQAGEKIRGNIMYSGRFVMGVVDG